MKSEFTADIADSSKATDLEHSQAAPQGQGLLFTSLSELMVSAYLNQLQE
jgi:hypothetical protein